RQVLSQRQVERLTIVRACLFLGISRQAYYKRNRVADERHAQGLQVVRFVRQVRLRQPRVGTRKLHYLLQGQEDGGLKVGRDRLFRILAEHRLLVQPKRAYHKTTHSFHRFYRHPNLLKAGP
ncbi:IS3 family transposase, partial [Aeromonas veronii]